VLRQHQVEHDEVRALAAAVMPAAAQKLGIYLPNTGTSPFPVIVSIHGGAFKSGEAIWPAQLHDIKAAIRFIRANAAQYRLNPDRIAAWGGSAGGHLAVLLGKQITLVPDLVKQANPETYLDANDPPFLIQHGTADVLIPSQQSVDFAAALQKVLGTQKVTFELRLPLGPASDVLGSGDLGVRVHDGPVDLHEARTASGKRFRLLNLPLFLAGRLSAYLDWAFRG